MTNMYLLWEWTEEREAKIHHGIFSTPEKAKQAAQLDYESNFDPWDLEDEEAEKWEEGDPIPALAWSVLSYSDDLTGEKPGPRSGDTPYQITEFEVDIYTVYSYGPGTENPSKKRHTL